MAYPTQDIPGVSILGVQPRFTNSGKQCFDIQMSNGASYTTFRPEAASKAQGLLNQQGTLRISINGKYQNYEDFQPGGMVVGAAAPAAPQFTQPQVASPPVQQFTPAPDTKEPRIIRGNALNASAALLGPLVGSGLYLDDEGNLDLGKLIGHWLAVADQAVPYLTNGASPTGGNVAAPAAAPQTAAEVAAALQAQGMPVQVGAPVPPEGEASPY